MSKHFRTALVVAVALGGTAAEAKTFTPDYFYEDGSVTCAVSDVSPTADACYGMSQGSAQSLDYNLDFFNDVQGLFGYSDWAEVQKDEEYGGDEKFGTLDILSTSYTMIALFLKAGPEFSVYRFDTGLSGSLDFTMPNDKGLSDYLVVGRAPLTQISAVPLPAGAPLLIGGFGVLGLLRRRKKSA